MAATRATTTVLLGLSLLVGVGWALDNLARDVGRQDFELVALLHRAEPDDGASVFRVLDVSRQRGRGRGSWADAFKQRGIAVAAREHAGRTSVGPTRPHVNEVTIQREMDHVLPDPTDKATVLSLAEMTYNAYLDYNATEDWLDVPGYDPEYGFGWLTNDLRGYLYMNENKSIAILDFKGTTLSFLGTGGPTSEKDKLIDNLMFSCCCARVTTHWEPVCGCYEGDGSSHQCSAWCLNKTLASPETLSYFALAEEILHYSRHLYPEASFWTTGHSLGGSIASLIAAYYGLAAVTFEAPGELQYAQRLGFNVDSDDMGDYDIFHFGNNVDPIFMGTCTGTFSACGVSGYALETACHIGNTCTYAVGGYSNVNNHRIGTVIAGFIEPYPLPTCKPQNGCTECAHWTIIP